MSRDPEPHGAVDKFEGDSKQPLGNQVLAYRNVMRCKWAVRKTARPKNGGRLAAQIRATKSEAQQYLTAKRFRKSVALKPQLSNCWTSLFVARIWAARRPPFLGRAVLRTARLHRMTLRYANT